MSVIGGSSKLQSVDVDVTCGVAQLPASRPSSAQAFHRKSFRPFRICKSTNSQERAVCERADWLARNTTILFAIDLLQNSQLRETTAINIGTLLYSVAPSLFIANDRAFCATTHDCMFGSQTRLGRDASPLYGHKELLISYKYLCFLLSTTLDFDLLRGQVRDTVFVASIPITICPLFLYFTTWCARAWIIFTQFVLVMLLLLCQIKLNVILDRATAWKVSLSNPRHDLRL